MKALSLTGGSGDVNPNWLKISVTQSAADTFTQSTNPIPVQRLKSNGKSQVMEILKVHWENISAITETDNSYNAFLTTKSYSSAPPLTDGPVIDHVRRNIILTTSGQVVVDQPVIHDLTDGAGHGVLVGTDNLYLSLGSATTGVAGQMTAWILYRWKNIGMAEYIGIVQSQQ